jgi:osmoprotectant transport system ATP-binding protein
VATGYNAVMIELRGVRKSLGGREVLHPTDLVVPAGSATVLLGPSGCGKSTLLRLMLGLIRPDGGDVVFDGRPLTTDNALAARQRMGYVVQDGGLFPHLTAEGNAGLMARHLGWPTDRIAARLDELADLTRLPHELLDRYPAQLSGGQRQRVGLVRALMLDPAVLLLDEPLGALDPLVRADLQVDLRDVFRTLAKTVVLVTHDLSEAAFFADEVVLLRDGRVVQRGRPADLVRAPAEPYVTRFIQAQRPAAFLAGADA